MNIYPTLNIPNQSIEAGQSFSYTIKASDISGVTSVSEATISITSDGGSGVTFNNIAFVRRTAFNSSGNYVIRGTITNSRRSASWSFNLVVSTKPSTTVLPKLNIPDQVIDAGRSFFYLVKLRDLSGISRLSGSSKGTISLTSDGGSGIVLLGPDYKSI